MSYSLSLSKSARAFRATNAVNRTKISKFQTFKARVRNYTSNNTKFNIKSDAKSDKTSSRTRPTNDHDDGKMTWKEKLFCIFGTGSLYTGGLYLDHLLSKGLRPQLTAQERRADAAMLYYVHGM